MIAGNEWLDIQNLKKDKFRINDCREWMARYSELKKR